MSDLAAAAAAMGLPESLVERSAEARAAETGESVDAVLAAWAGGESAPVTAAAPASEPAAAPTETAAATPEPAAPAPAAIVAPTAPPQPVATVPTGPYKPPVLIGASDSPLRLVLGVLGLFVMVALIAVVGPSLAVDEAGARSSKVSYSAAAVEGQDTYLSLGCAACHTQMVRPVIADVGLGPVTLNDTNQVIGTRRFGPDLADVGTRLSAADIEAIVLGAGDHIEHSLSGADLDNLVAYLSESKGN